MLRGCGLGGVAFLLAGCFAQPSTGGETDDGGSTSSTSNMTTTLTEPVTTAISVTASASAETSGTTTDAGSSSSGSSSLGSSSSGDEASDTSTGRDSICADGEVQVGSLCLTPLVVDTVLTAAMPDALASADGEPCVRAECVTGTPLGGGFLVDGMLPYASHRDVDGVRWTTCGGADMDAAGDLWQGFARCSVADGDTFVVTETYELDGDEGTSCFDVSCPMGTAVVGGGGRWGPDFVFQGSAPNDDGSRWEICGSGNLVATEIEVDAHCAVLPEGVTTSVVSEDVPVAPGSSECVSVGCEGGLAIAGGANAGITISVLGSYPDPEDDQRWVACGRADGVFSVETRARVLCLDQPAL